jgi:hypothetical protein
MGLFFGGGLSPGFYVAITLFRYYRAIDLGFYLSFQN